MRRAVASLWLRAAAGAALLAPAALAARGRVHSSISVHAGAARATVAVVLALVLLAGAAGGLIATRHRGQRPGARSFRHARGGAARALSDEPLPEDPRAAVLEAYTRTEAALAYSGQPRCRGEPPRRYSRRVAVVQPEVAVAVDELTDQAETAAFSAHDVAPADRQRAASALAVVVRRGTQTGGGRAVKPG